MDHHTRQQAAVTPADVTAPVSTGHGEHGAMADQTGHAAHDRHEGHSVSMFRDKFWVSLALTIPVVILSPEVAEWLGDTIPDLPGIEQGPAIARAHLIFYG